MESPTSIDFSTFPIIAGLRNFADDCSWWEWRDMLLYSKDSKPGHIEYLLESTTDLRIEMN